MLSQSSSIHCTLLYISTKEKQKYFKYKKQKYFKYKKQKYSKYKKHKYQNLVHSIISLKKYFEIFQHDSCWFMSLQVLTNSLFY